MRPAIVSLQHLEKRRLSPTGQLNLGFITKRKLAAVLIIPSLLGFPTVQPSSTSRPGSNKIFWRRCRGERALLQGESLTLNLFTLLSFLVSYFCLLHFIKNPKN